MRALIGRVNDKDRTWAQNTILTTELLKCVVQYAGEAG